MHLSRSSIIALHPLSFLPFIFYFFHFFLLPLHVVEAAPAASQPYAGYPAEAKVNAVAPLSRRAHCADCYLPSAAVSGGNHW